MKYLLKIALLVALLIPAASLRAEEAGEKPDIKQIVLGHLGDSYEWHVLTTSGGEWSIPLPVIVHSPSSGWHLFSAARLREGAEYEGLRIAPDGEYAGKIVERQADGSDLRPLDLSLTKPPRRWC